MKKTGTLLLLTLLLTAGCAEKDMFNNIHIRPDTTLPIGHVIATDSSLFDLAGVQKNMKVGLDGVLTFVDSTELTLSKPGVGISLIEIPAQDFTLYKALPTLPSIGGFVDLPAGQVTENFTLTVPDGAVVDTVVFRSGSFSVSVVGLEGIAGYDKAQLKIIVRNLLKDKQPVTLVAGVPLLLDASYMLVPDAGNRITVEFQGRVPATLVALDGGVNVDGGEVDYIAGFFGRKEISNISRTISAGALSDFTANADYVRFDRPQVTFLLDNEYNAPMMADITGLRVDGVPVALKPGLAGQLIYVAPKTSTKVVIDNTNTVTGNGLTEALTKDFQQLAIDVNTLLNPTASDMQDPSYVPAAHNSMGASDTLGGAFAINLPLDGVLGGVAFDQELEVDLAKLDKKDIDYKNLTLTLSGTNSLPLDLQIVVSVREPGSDISVPLFEEPVQFPSSINNLKPNDPAFLPGVVNQQNLIVRSLSAAMIDRLLKADKLYLHLTASTMGAAQRTSAKIYSPAQLDLKIVAGAKLDLTVNPK